MQREATGAEAVENAVKIARSFTCRPGVQTGPGDLARPAAELTRQVVAEAARRGLILLSCGTHGNVIRVLVPLTAEDTLVDEGLQLLADSFAALR
jgi:4-aminobutyrate aminotransferase-like enzyme